MPKNDFDLNKTLKGFQKEKQHRAVQKASRKLKPNRESKPPRHKDWRNSDYDEYSGGKERIMPRGERERRQAVLDAAQKKLQQEEALKAANNDFEQLEGRLGVVVEVSTGLCRVDIDGEILLCALRGSLSAEETGFTNVVAVGDEVIVAEDADIVEQVLPRRSVLARPDVFYGHLRQAIVANADQLLIVASWRDPHIWLELIDRYLITAERDNLMPIICVNKIDLAEDRAVVDEQLQPYRDMGIEVITTSTITGEGIEQLREMMQDRATVLAGLSGVGKSSLLSTVEPGLNLRVGRVNEEYGQGRHTTTQALMVRFSIGGFVIDTPGIREFGLSGLSRQELVDFYPDILEVAHNCRFKNCSHLTEPGCAVRVAVAKGHLPEWRYHNYQKIYESLAE